METILENSFILTQVIVPILYSVLVILASAVLYKLFKKYSESEHYNQAIEYLRSGVEQTYQQYVRVLKESAVDGKLTKEQRLNARQMAWNKAKEMALAEGKEAALKLMTSFTWDHVQALIERLVNKAKKDGEPDSSVVIIPEKPEEAENGDSQTDSPVDPSLN